MKEYSEAHLNILTTTKDVYINQIINSLEKFLYEGIMKQYKLSLREKNKFEVFRKRLSDIPNWNQHVIDNEYAKFLEYNNETKFERLIRAIFVTYTKILTSVKMNYNKKNIKLI